MMEGLGISTDVTKRRWSEIAKQSDHTI